MKYPAFLKPGSTIGICAPSAGVGNKLPAFQTSVDHLKSYGYQIKETKSVRNNDTRSADAETRAAELNELFAANNVDMIMAASGGDFLDEILPFADFRNMAEHPKWLMGASDPTGILYPYTTLCDVATFYGHNGGSYDEDQFPYIQNNLALLKGEDIVQKSSKKYLSTPPFLVDAITFDTPTRWLSSQQELHVTGRCIGGCLDVLKDLIGTKYDGTHQFLERYKKDPIIWYFDNFSLSAEVTYRTFLQMRYAGWFENTIAVLFGRVCFPSSENGMTYPEALQRAFPDIPWIAEADIGHTVPAMTMVNGAILDFSYTESGSTLHFQYK